MVDYDYLEDYRDPQTYDLLEEGYDEDYPLTRQWARSLGWAAAGSGVWNRNDGNPHDKGRL